MASLNRIFAPGAPDPDHPTVPIGGSIDLQVDATPDADRTDVIEGRLVSTGQTARVEIRALGRPLTFGLEGSGADVQLRVVSGNADGLQYVGGIGFSYKS